MSEPRSREAVPAYALLLLDPVNLMSTGPDQPAEG